MVGTDHCPFDFHGQKEMVIGDFRKIPNGLPGVEERVDLIHQGVVDGRLTKERWVDVVSTGPAKMFGLFPKKGAVAVGSDADIVIYDPNREQVAVRVHAPHGRRLLLLRGTRRQGRRATSSCRAGTVVVRDRAWTGPAGHGKYPPARPRHLRPAQLTGWVPGTRQGAGVGRPACAGITSSLRPPRRHRLRSRRRPPPIARVVPRPRPRSRS